MSVFITFAAALLIFGAVIAIHEFGHFAVAKLCGVQVNEFSIGMGPTLIKTYRKGTQYTLRLLPVGGFVALEGEESPESDKRARGDAAHGRHGVTVLAVSDHAGDCAPRKGMFLMFQK